jgi:hypothetical protein
VHKSVNEDVSNKYSKKNIIIGIEIVERVDCSTTDNFYGSLYRSGSIESRFIMYMDLVRPGFKSCRKQQRHKRD